VPEFLKRGLAQSESVTREVKDTVSDILSSVQAEGESAVRRFSERFDKWSPARFTVDRSEVEKARASVDDELAEHIEKAREQVGRFAQRQLETMLELEVETLPGVVLGHRHVPVEAVGSYSPGGVYPLIASSIMTVTTPKVAGVDRVVATAPPRDAQGIFLPQLYTIDRCGADQVLCLGGVQALAALAFGIEDIEPVDMIVGAGNAYVAEAKRQLFGTVGIDLLAGPTEVAVIADETADPRIVAADLLGQAEHGPNSPAILMTTSLDLGHQVAREVDAWLEGDWPTKEIAGAAWRDFGTIVVCENDDELVEVSDRYAPEHLEVQTKNPDWFHRRLRNYGSLFLGHESTVAYSDKSIGTNHVLPTRGAARYTGGLWVGKFLKTLTFQKVTEVGSKEVAPTTAAIADAEFMFGHALTARLRIDDK